MKIASYFDFRKPEGRERLLILFTVASFLMLALGYVLIFYILS